MHEREKGCELPWGGGEQEGVVGGGGRGGERERERQSSRFNKTQITSETSTEQSTEGSWGDGGQGEGDRAAGLIPIKLHQKCQPNTAHGRSNWGKGGGGEGTGAEGRQSCRFNETQITSETSTKHSTWKVKVCVWGVGGGGGGGLGWKGDRAAGLTRLKLHQKHQQNKSTWKVKGTAGYRAVLQFNKTQITSEISTEQSNWNVKGGGWGETDRAAGLTRLKLHQKCQQNRAVSKVKGGGGERETERAAGLTTQITTEMSTEQSSSKVKRGRGGGGGKEREQQV